MSPFLSAPDYLLNANNAAVIDVRAESEYMQGHIPGAFNLPLFNDEERAIVGTLYKNSGKNTSVLKGLEFAGPKLAGFVKSLHKITDKKHVLVHCWRGGLRSASMAWLFELAGYEAFILSGGYKAYRQYMHDQFDKNYMFILIGGKTGSGKTSLLHELRSSGEQIIDLEALAHHKGSAFGGREDGFQPTNEQFFNDIFHDLQQLDPKKVIWIEDESRKIGKVSVPDQIYKKMSDAPLIKIDEPFEARVNRLIGDYASLPNEYLESCISRIKEKLGNDNAKKASEALKQSDFRFVAEIALRYYDKVYEHSILSKDKDIIFNFSPYNSGGIITRLIELKNKVLNGSDIS